MRQRYVSKELTHFVGRNLCDDDEKYKLLLKILTSGKLLSSRPPTNIINVGPGIKMEGNLSISGSKAFSTAEMVHSQTVSFCDIPLNDLGIHMDKYSKFGLSFLKSFLLQKGANPVFYLATESTFYTGFDEIIKKIMSAHSISVRPMDENYDINIRDFMDLIISFMKPFGRTLEDDSEEHYYMEREWALLGSVSFSLKDVHRIILPKDYIVQLKNDLDNYVSDISSAESFE